MAACSLAEGDGGDDDSEKTSGGLISPSPFSDGVMEMGVECPEMVVVAGAMEISASDDGATSLSPLTIPPWFRQKLSKPKLPRLLLKKSKPNFAKPIFVNRLSVVQIKITACSKFLKIKITTPTRN
nr:uncharacterized protein LOC109167189 [Ipomoea batatas]